MEKEWYVVSEGQTFMFPKTIVQGRRRAVDTLTIGFKLTPKEKLQVSKFLEGQPEVGERLQLVGFWKENGDFQWDRSITRVEVT